MESWWDRVGRGWVHSFIMTHFSQEPISGTQPILWNHYQSHHGGTCDQSHAIGLISWRFHYLSTAPHWGPRLPHMNLKETHSNHMQTLAQWITSDIPGVASNSKGWTVLHSTLHSGGQSCSGALTQECTGLGAGTWLCFLGWSLFPPTGFWFASLFTKFHAYLILG